MKTDPDPVKKALEKAEKWRRRRGTRNIQKIR